MKFLSKRLISTKTLIFCLVFMAINLSSKAQGETKEFKDFKISIEKNHGEIVMKCDVGCAWIDLAYENNKDFQAINELGMTKLSQNQTDKEIELANFLFTVTKDDQGISLKGIEGTAWTDLSFSLRQGQKQLINQFGMTD